MAIAGVILIIVGMTMIVKPAMVWLVTESWKTNDGSEPSDFYIWSTRFGGIMVTLAGIGAILVTVL